jgi:uncharacterized protein YjbJ (UPF0337 family)
MTRMPLRSSGRGSRQLPWSRRREGPLDRVQEWAGERAEQVRESDVPAWTLIAAGAAGLAVGLGIGMWLARRRTDRRARRKLQSAADEIKAAWPDVTDEDIRRAKGSAARLAETIRERTGESAETIRGRLAGITEQKNGANGGGEG